MVSVIRSGPLRIFLVLDQKCECQAHPTKKTEPLRKWEQNPLNDSYNVNKFVRKFLMYEEFLVKLWSRTQVRINQCVPNNFDETSGWNPEESVRERSRKKKALDGMVFSQSYLIDLSWTSLELDNLSYM